MDHTRTRARQPGWAWVRSERDARGIWFVLDLNLLLAYIYRFYLSLTRFSEPNLFLINYLPYVKSFWFSLLLVKPI